MSDVKALIEEKFYSTIKMTGYNHTVFVYVRTGEGAEVIKFDTIAQKWSLSPLFVTMKSADGWNRPSVLPDHQSSPMRDPIGSYTAEGPASTVLVAYNFDKGSWSALPALTDYLTDAQGWSNSTLYSRSAWTRSTTSSSSSLAAARWCIPDCLTSPRAPGPLDPLPVNSLTRFIVMSSICRR